MNDPISSSAKKVQAALNATGLIFSVQELSASTRTAQEAANAVGCQVGQIVKSLVFRTKDSQQPVLVLASGPNRVNEDKIGSIISEAIEKADSNFVKEKTGFAIGGVPPVGHLEPLRTLIDEDLLHYQELWAAAGTPNAVFKLSSSDLIEVTGGSVVSVK